MWWAQAFSAGMSLFGARKQKRAAKQARRLAGMNADASLVESGEKSRRMRAEFKQIEGAAETYAAASGFSQRKGESQSSYIASMVAEHGRQLSFEYKASKSRANIIRQGGQVAYQQGVASSFASMADAAGSLGQMWKNPNAPWNT